MELLLERALLPNGQGYFRHVLEQTPEKRKTVQDWIDETSISRVRTENERRHKGERVYPGEVSVTVMESSFMSPEENLKRSLPIQSTRCLQSVATSQLSDSPDSQQCLGDREVQGEKHSEFMKGQSLTAQQVLVKEGERLVQKRLGDLFSLYTRRVL